MASLKTLGIMLLLMLSAATVSHAAKDDPNKNTPLDENRTLSQKCTKFLMERVVLNLQVKVNRSGQPKLKVFDSKTLLGKLLNGIMPAFNKTLKLDELGEALYRLEQSAGNGKPYFERLTDALELKSEMHGDAWKSIPKNKPIIFYANHSMPGADAFTIAHEISKVRPDLKVISAMYLSGLPGFGEHAFFVNNMNTAASKAYNKLVIPKINEHLKNGGALLIFPSGAVSKWQLPRMDYAKDVAWRSGFLKFAEQSKETQLVPMFVWGQPSREYLKIRESNQSLSKAYSFREIAENIGKTIHITAGDPIPYSYLKISSENERIQRLRKALYEQGEEYFKTLSPNYQELIDFAARQEP